MSHFVYLIGPIDGYYKIGRTADTKRRIAKFQFPVTPKIQHFIKTKDCKWLEKYLHVAFAHARIRLEWFTFSKEDIASIILIKEIASLDYVPEWLVALNAANKLKEKSYKYDRPGRPAGREGKLIRLQVHVEQSVIDWCKRTGGTVYAGAQAALRKAAGADSK